MRSIILLATVLSIPAVAQDAEVIELSRAEVATARELAMEQASLDARKEALRIQIVRNHLEAPQSQAAGCVVESRVVLSAWGCGEFQYSRDLRFIVPSAHLSTAPYGSALFHLVDGVPTAIEQSSDVGGDDPQ